MPRKKLVAGVVFSLTCLLGVVLLIGAAWAWLNIRPQPQATKQKLFQGITYVREVRQSPRPMVIHVVTVDLREPGIAILVTPGDPGTALPVEARTTTQFLNEFGVQIAVNGDGFTPWYTNNILNYYPHPGDPVDPIGLAASRGTIYSTETSDEPVLHFARTNRARFNSQFSKMYNAISGNLMLVKQGKSLLGQAVELPDQHNIPQPRTALALDKAGRRLIIVVVDGRQPNYSEGATLAELAEIIIAYNGHDGMNLDGGGSTTLAMEGKNGRAALLNSPIHQRIPGRQRPVANHLGIFASPVVDQ